MAGRNAPCRSGAGEDGRLRPPAAGVGGGEDGRLRPPAAGVGGERSEPPLIVEKVFTPVIVSAGVELTVARLLSGTPVALLVTVKLPMMSVRVVPLSARDALASRLRDRPVDDGLVAPLGLRLLDLRDEQLEGAERGMRHRVRAALERRAERTGEREHEGVLAAPSDLSTAAPARSSTDSSRSSTDPTLKLAHEPVVRRAQQVAGSGGRRGGRPRT